MTSTLTRMARHGGGWRALAYTLRKGREVGFLRLWRAMRSKNACKTCALGMGGQLGGMVNEAGRFPEVCKKSLQAMASDMRGRIDERFFATYTIDDLRGMTSRELEAVGRLDFPVVAHPGDSHFKPVDWDEALDLVADRLAAADPRQTFFYASGRSSNEAGFLLHLLARSRGTNHLSNCSYYCHQASGVGLADSIGTATATVALEDLDACDLMFLIGANPASNHPRFMTTLLELRRRGGNVVVVNPLREPGLVEFRVPSRLRSLLFASPIASRYVQPKIGGDIAFLAGLAKALFEMGAVDEAYIERHTEGFEAFRDLVEATTWEAIEAGSGVDRTEVEAAARDYAESERTVFAWSMGITHHEHGVENVHWITNLALLRGMVGKSGAGLLPIRGHSNVQGLGSVGVTPRAREAVLARLAELGVKPPDWEGYDTMGALEAAHRGEMDFALCLGGNLYGASPDAAFTARGLNSVNTVVYLNTSLNIGHAKGTGKTTLILPVRARDEDDQATTQESMFSYVRLSDGGPARVGGARTETAILAGLGERLAVRSALAGDLPWNELGDHDAIRRLIARVVPGLEELERIGETKREFQIPGRILHEPRFGTASGRARFHADPLPTPPAGMRLMTIRSEGQFNTVVYEEEDLYRGASRRDVAFLHQADMERLGLAEGGWARVSSQAGSMIVQALAGEIAQGCVAMYYPEANGLTTTAIDPRSRTPAFKSTIVEVEPCEGPEVRTPLTELPMAELQPTMEPC